jgi:hypothetical protein
MKRVEKVVGKLGSDSGLSRWLVLVGKAICQESCVEVMFRLKNKEFLLSLVSGGNWSEFLSTPAWAIPSGFHVNSHWDDGIIPAWLT